MPAPAEPIDSPYDPQARYSVRRDTTRVGYKVHQTETCDAEAPRLIVNVETTAATVPDDNMLATVACRVLARRQLLPAEHLVDKGYTSAQALLDSERNDGVRIVGPVADNPSWQARAGAGFDKAHFRSPHRRLSRRPAPPLLVTENHSPRDRGRGPFRGGRLHPVPASHPLHPIDKGAPYHWHTIPRPVRSAPDGLSGSNRRAQYAAAQGSKAPTRKASVAAVCASAATSDRPRPACSMWSRRSPLT